MTRILIADGLAPEGIQKLRAISGVELSEHTAIERKDLKEVIPTIDILIVRSRTQVDADLLEGARNLKLAIRAGIGLDNIDVPAATDRGVVVMNAPTGNIVTTAEHTIGMIFAVSRHIPQADATLRTGKWEKKKFQGSELRGKTLGLVGLGNIGKVVADRALGLKMRVVTFDPFLSAEAAAKHHVELVSFDELLKTSDYVSIHAPLTNSTRNLLNRDAIFKMKKGAFLINCARGGMVDEKALAEALDQGHLHGAALDVFETEPLPADHPLLKKTNAVLTPHLGASTDEAQLQVGLEVAEQVEQYVKAGVFKNAVNVPNISAEQLSTMKPYLKLCERLGSFAAQLSGGQSLKKVKIHYSGYLTTLDRQPLTLSLLKGFLTPLLSTPVNHVNAKKLMKERGVAFEESFEQDCDDYQSLIEIRIDGATPLTVAGTLFGKEEPRIVRVDGFNIDALPEGHLLFTTNVDQPGVIGSMGSTLGSAGVNIARMHLGRDASKGQAIAIINVDSELNTATIEALRKIKGMLSVKQIRL